MAGVLARATPKQAWVRAEDSLSRSKRLMKHIGAVASDRLPLLRVFLSFGAIAWGASFYGVFATWPDAVAALQGLGAGTIPADPMLDYWLRMASGAFGLVGCLFLVLAWQPERHRAIIPWFGGLMLTEGVILLGHGLRLGLGPLPFMADTAACFVGGWGILFCSRRAGFRSWAG